MHSDLPTSHDWKLLRSQPDDGPATIAAIGLLALASDIVIEHEVRRFLPAEGVGLYTNRLRMGGELTPENIRSLANDIPRAVRDLVPDDQLDVVVFGCTSGAMAVGPDIIAQKINSVRPDVAVTDPISASIRAFHALGAGSLAVITPYSDSISMTIEDYLHLHAPPIIARGSFKQEGDPTISRVSPKAIFEAAVAMGKEPVDAVFICCTALRCASVITAIETQIGKPVITSNQALAWNALRLAKFEGSLAHGGELFNRP